MNDFRGFIHDGLVRLLHHRKRCPQNRSCRAGCFEIERTMSISVGFLFQLWLDIGLIGVLATGILVSVMLMIRWYRRRRSVT